MKLTIIIPIFNEEKFLQTLLELVLKQKLNITKEIIAVDDCSTDNSKEILKKFKDKIEHIIYHTKNAGKGAAIQSALHVSTGDIVLIQDADLEYDPNDYQKLIKPILDGGTKVVYGSRVLNKKRYSNNSFTSLFRVFANHVLTIFSNILNNQKLTDAHTCYKVFHKDVLKQINLEENGFSFCPEITTKISNLKINIHEVPISYSGRSYLDGKKIKFSDGIEAIKSIIKYKFDV